MASRHVYHAPARPGTVSRAHRPERPDAATPDCVLDSKAGRRAGGCHLRSGLDRHGDARRGQCTALRAGPAETAHADATGPADEGRPAPGRLRPVPRQQRPAVLPPRCPRRPGEEVHRREEHDSLQDAEGRHPDSARPHGNADNREDPLPFEGTEVRARLGRGVRGLPGDAQAGHGPFHRLLLLGLPEGDRPLRRHCVPEGPCRPPLDQHRLPGHRAPASGGPTRTSCSTKSRTCG